MKLLPLLMLAMLPAAQAHDPALLGCWRAQHLTQHLANGKTLHTNGDCVLDFSETELRSACANDDGSVRTTLSAYRLTAPGRYDLTVKRDDASTEPTPMQSVDYVVDENWLTIRSALPAKADTTAHAAVSLESLSVRVPPTSGPCEVRGPQATRVGHGRVSSLRIEPPPGFVALVRDPPAHSELAQLVRDNTLIGIFVPGESSAPPAAGYRHFLVAIEDGRSGARPVKPADFPAFKTLVSAELNAATMAPTSQRYLGVSCDTPERICFDAAQTRPGARGKSAPATGYVTALFVNIKGRVVVIYGVADGADPKQLRAVQRDTHALADLLKQLNR